ncbi:MAG: MBL fold metallo-hydrolase [Gammaproteobacteria bacterium]|nr:MAG: MBL fold metallo-hydrolase [Gammaproteobacteria bacterium]
MSVAEAALSGPVPPATGGWVELKGDVLWGRLPVPGMLGHVNVWLLPEPGGWWLVDSGLPQPAVELAWAGLAEAIDLRSRLRGIVVTHHHPDHIGMAARLAAEYDVPVRCSQATYQAAESALRPEPAAALAAFEDWAAAHGVPADQELRELLTGALYARMISGLPVPAPFLNQGEDLPLSAPWRISLHEGHAPGHVCLYNAVDDLLISGDQVLPSISPNISLHPGGRDDDPLGQYLASLRELRGIPDTAMVLPAHGRPFNHLHSRLDQLAAEHATRLRAIEAALVTPRALDEVVALLFRVRLSDIFNRMLAIGETLAHLRHLEVAGRVRRQGRGPALRWVGQE